MPHARPSFGGRLRRRALATPALALVAPVHGLATPPEGAVMAVIAAPGAVAGASWDDAVWIERHRALLDAMLGVEEVP